MRHNLVSSRIVDHSDVVGASAGGAGHRFTNGFSIAFQIRLKFRFTFTSILIPWSLQNFVHARQLCCCGMCKNLLRSDGQQQNYSKAKFPSNFDCGQKIVSETGPCSNYILIFDLTPGFNGLDKDNCKTRQKTFKYLGFDVPYIRGLTVFSKFSKVWQSEWV